MRPLRVVILAVTSTGVQAQSGVTLYGAVDLGINLTSNASGHSAYSMASGNAQASMWGVRGMENLGGGLAAVFTLENGFQASNGTVSNENRGFGRQAFVGLSSQPYGALTLGRQFDATIDLWSPMTGAGNVLGDLAAHPFDNDNADGAIITSNMMKYVSPTYAGFQLEATYAFSNDAGFDNDRAYSAAISYSKNWISVVASYMKGNNGGIAETGAWGVKVPFVAASQQIIGTGVRLTASDHSNVGLAYSHVDVRDPIGGVFLRNLEARGWQRMRFDNVELNGQYFIRSNLFVALAYAYTRASASGTSSTNAASWHQLTATVHYDFSKQTSIYLQAAWQRARGGGDIGFDRARILGGAGSSSGGSQTSGRIALVQSF